MSPSRVPVFDLDGTLLDSDRALVEPFVAFGVEEDEIDFGQPLLEACSRFGVDVDEYLAVYDTSLATPFPDVDELIRGLARWAIFSNKLDAYARAEIARVGWVPEVALFSEAFGGPKRLEPVLEALDLSPREIVCVGDSDHDRACARTVGADFALAAWNPRASSEPGDIVLTKPADLLGVL